MTCFGSATKSYASAFQRKITPGPATNLQRLCQQLRVAVRCHQRRKVRVDAVGDDERDLIRSHQIRVFDPR